MQADKTDKDFVVIGRIGATYGIQGWVKIQTFTESAEDVLSYKPWHLQYGNDWKPVKLEDGKLHGKGVVAKLEGWNNPEDARQLTGKTIGVLRSELPSLKQGEYYWSDLEGLTVINKDGAVLGKVIYLMATGTNDVLVVKGTKEIAIPYLPDDVVLSIDLAKQEMHVDWDPI